MSDDSLIAALPEFVAFVRRDGTILKALGGRGVDLPENGGAVGRRITDIWPDDVAGVLLHLIRHALRDRGTADGRFSHAGKSYEARTVAQGRDRVLAVIREAPRAEPTHPGDGVREADSYAVDRRDLFDRLTQSIAGAKLTEHRLALCVIHLEGIEDLGRALDYSIVDTLIGVLTGRVARLLDGKPCGFTGRLAESVLVAAVEQFSGREELRRITEQIIGVLAQAVTVGDATFTATPRMGVAVLGEDGFDTRQLLSGARSAMTEARRAMEDQARFTSDTLQLRTLVRVDLERELRQSIEADQLDLRYAGRYAIDSGTLIAVHAYLRWDHPIRGTIPAAEFIPIAESTGLSTLLSTWALGRLRRDVAAIRAVAGPGVRLSFGGLRSHLAGPGLREELTAFFAAGPIEPQEFELRISERVLAGLPESGAELKPLAQIGVRLIVDEFGRGFSSLPRLARLPLFGLQLDRRIALAASADPVARRAAAAVMAMAKALGLSTLSAGVDTTAQRSLLASLGCMEALGDAFPALSLAKTPLQQQMPSLGGSRRIHG